MKSIRLIFLICFTLHFVSSISLLKPSLFIEKFSQSLYIHLNPKFQNTYQQLIEIVTEFSSKSSQLIQQRSFHSTNPQPAEWVSHLFNGSNSISTQWNNHIVDFFGNIPTVFENNDRSLINFISINKRLHSTIDELIENLENIFNNNMNQLIIQFINEYKLKSNEINIIYQNFQEKTSNLFKQTKVDLKQTTDDLSNNIFSIINQFFG